MASRLAYLMSRRNTPSRVVSRKTYGSTRTYSRGCGGIRRRPVRTNIDATHTGPDNSPDDVASFSIKAKLNRYRRRQPRLTRRRYFRRRFRRSRRFRRRYGR